MSFIVAGVTAIGGGSLLAGAGVVAGVGSAIAKGFGGPSQHDINVQQTAAHEMYQEKLGLLGEQKGLTVQAADLGYEAAQSQFAGGQRDVAMGAQMGMRDIQAGAGTAASRSCLATYFSGIDRARSAKSLRVSFKSFS